MRVWAANGVPVAAELNLRRTVGDERVVRISLSDDAAETIAVARGETVRLEVEATKAVELNLHGYDLVGQAGPGTPAIFAIQATITGRFPIVSHHGDDLIGRGERPRAYLEVRPE